jgi:uncharacterized protein YkwD
MTRSDRRPRHARPAAGSLLAALALVASLLAVPAPALAVDDAEISAAEAAMIALLNEDRTAVGLVPAQVDSRLMAIARARSVDMATKGYFSHTQPDGRNVFDILNSAKVTWYNAGEIIAWNNYPMDSTASAANRQWLNSSGHRAIIVSNQMNYVGVGLAVDPGTGKKYWTAVFIKGPDRTGARATTAAPSVARGSTGATKRVTVSWSGADVPLQVLTSGLHSYQVQRRTDRGAWVTVATSTTVRSLTLDLAVNHTYEFRVAARDKAGNWGAWSTAKTTIGRPTGVVRVYR